MSLLQACGVFLYRFSSSCDYKLCPYTCQLRQLQSIKDRLTAFAKKMYWVYKNLLISYNVKNNNGKSDQ